MSDRTRWVRAITIAVVSSTGACMPAIESGMTGSGGSGSGGAGQSGTGGMAPPGSGGRMATGGATQSGGAAGMSSSGGAGSASGGAGTASGGTGTASGGAPASGGIPGMAGRFGSGGAAGAGGVGKSGGTSGTAGRAGAPGNGGGGMGVVATGGAPAPDCSKAAKAPASFQTLTGFTSSEDFVFDLQGNYVAVDDNHNLVRISKDKKKQLWVPNLGEVAGMGLLPDGSVVFCNVDKGALQRVNTAGSVVTVLGGLLYPNGLDIGQDGFIYVAENGAGRVRRVNPTTGEFTIVAIGLQGPNGVAVSADPKTLYVGSFEGSGVYKVSIPSPGELGQSTVFARPNGSQLAEPKLACPAMQEGVACEVPGQFTGGTCRRLANVIDCVKDTIISACGANGCTMSTHGGGIDGLGVDACGNVYATEFSYGGWAASNETSST
jgi:hypothetical protein